MSVLVILAATALLITFLGFFLRVDWIRWLATLGFAGALLAQLLSWNHTQVLFEGLYVYNAFSQGVTLAILVGALLTVLVGQRYMRQGDHEQFEYYALLAFAILGAHVMSATDNLVVMLIGIELLSIPFYVLAGFRRDLASYEASLKYFLLGAVASGVLLYGIVLHYGAVQSFSVAVAGHGTLYAVALSMILVGLGFKASLAPFQWWVPDVYQGSPTPVTLVMATGVKAAAFAALARVIVGAGLGGPWSVLLAVMVVLTLLYGNLAALAQSEAKRVLAYSSVAHAGYLAVALFGPNPGPALGYYLLAYTLSTGLAFAVLSLMDKGEGVPYGNLHGLIYRSPLLGIVWAVAMLSLAGIPPFMGFWAKYLVFVEAVKGGAYGLVIFALVTSVVAAYYYLKLLSLATFTKPGQLEKPQAGTAARLTLGATAFVVLLIGVLPNLGYSLFSGASNLLH